ncbi:MAG: tRNA pseudouridine(55) synthase TruB [Patescibacteria group bacterium]|jgi:tRNA pseudouridine55 synthase
MPFLLIDKPVGPTSHDIVDQVRRITGERRVGHAGTLDPFASGLLIVAVGRESTKELSKFVGLGKVYEATFILGGSSDTDDRTGKITPVPLPPGLTEEKIKTAIGKFIGEIEQIPPAYAAIKIGGKKMYEAAREGKPLEAKARPVTIFEYDLTSTPLVKTDTVEIRVYIKCSSGTYIRALARDLGQALGTGGYVSELRRTAIGQYKVEDAKTL